MNVLVSHEVDGMHFLEMFLQVYPQNRRLWHEYLRLLDAQPPDARARDDWQIDIDNARKALSEAINR